MRKAYLALGGALVLSSAIAVAAMQEETPAAPAPSPEATVSEPVVQDIGRDAAPAVSLPRNLPSLEELERMSDDEFEELFDLKPKADIPAAARRSLRAVGLLAEGEGGLEAAALGPQPAALVEAALRGNRGRLVSRWGHIVLRRALASRLAAPKGMDPVDFAAMRTALLVRMGEGQVARGLAQQVDNIAYDTAMTAAAFDAFVATGDVVGACPMLEIVSPYDAEDPRIKVTRDICGAYSGRSAAALRQLERKRQQGVLSRTEMLLAQRYAGAGGEKIEPLARLQRIEHQRADRLLAHQNGVARLDMLQLAGQRPVRHLDRIEIKLFIPAGTGDGIGAQERLALDHQADHHELARTEAEALRAGHPE